MVRLMIRLNEAERTALSRAAWARRRQARELAELLLRRWLVKRGYLLDPSAAGQCCARQQSNTPARESLATQRAEVQ